MNRPPYASSPLCGKLRAAVREHHMLPPGARVLCAVSGGADSVALLYALRLMREELGLQGVSAAHFNHQLRGDASNADETFVRGLCAYLDIPLFQGRADVAAEAALRRTGLEETARLLRYAFLGETAEKAGCTHIATGHTADDNVETVLLHLTRGAGLSGLTGIPPVRGAIVRPLITCTRADIEAFLSDHGLRHVEDATNQDIALSRNRVRHRVVPELRAINPRLSAAVDGMLALLRQDEHCLTAQAREQLPFARRSDEGITFPVRRLTALHPALSTRLCRLLYEKATGRSAPLPSAHVEAMLALCHSGQPSGSIHLPGECTARRVYDQLIVGPPPEEPATFAPRTLAAGETVALPEVGLRCACRAAARPPGVGPSVFSVRADSVQGALTVRPRRAGDSLRLPGKPGGKLLKRLLIDARVPQHLREALPVLADDRGVVAVLGFGTDAAHTAAPGAPLLTVEITRGPRENGKPPLWDDMSWWP